MSYTGDSDGYSFTSGSISRQSSIHRLKPRPYSGGTNIAVVKDKVTYSRPQTASPDRAAKPPLWKSLFPRVPPVLTFVAEGEKGSTTYIYTIV